MRERWKTSKKTERALENSISGLLRWLAEKELSGRTFASVFSASSCFFAFSLLSVAFLPWFAVDSDLASHKSKDLKIPVLSLRLLLVLSNVSDGTKQI